MTPTDYSDDEIHRMLRRVLAEQQSAPTPTSMPKPQSVSGAGGRRELSFDEILKKYRARSRGRQFAASALRSALHEQQPCADQRRGAQSLSHTRRKARWNVVIAISVTSMKPVALLI